METTLIEKLEDLEADLRARAFLYDSPATFQEAIDIAFESVRAAIERARAA